MTQTREFLSLGISNKRKTGQEESVLIYQECVRFSLRREWPQMIYREHIQLLDTWINHKPVFLTKWCVIPWPPVLFQIQIEELGFDFLNFHTPTNKKWNTLWSLHTSNRDHVKKCRKLPLFRHKRHFILLTWERKYFGTLICRQNIARARARTAKFEGHSVYFASGALVRTKLTLKYLGLTLKRRL